MKQYGLLNEKGENFCCGCPSVMIDDKGTEHLFSYYTEIMTRTKAGKMTRIWDGWSNTTGKHIKAFCGLNKAGFCALPMAKKGG